MNFTPCFISLIDAYNNPILVESLIINDLNDELRNNVLANMALDYFDSNLYQWNSSDKNAAIKFFFKLEGCHVYGKLVHQTGLKIVLGFLDNSFEKMENSQEEIKKTFEVISCIFVRCKCNPFVLKEDDLANQLINCLRKAFPYDGC